MRDEVMRAGEASGEAPEGATGSRLRPLPRPGEAARGALGMAGPRGVPGRPPGPAQVRCAVCIGLYPPAPAGTCPLLPVHPRPSAAPGMRTHGCRDNSRLSSPPITVPVTLTTAAGAQ